MLLQTLRIVDFRNLEQLDLRCCPQFNIIFGDNGQGKTNLIEAVSLVLSSRSFRGNPRPEELIRFGYPQALLAALVRDTSGIEHDVLLRIDPKGKHLHLDGKVARRRTPSWPAIATISFTPDELRVPRASPSERRRLLDHGIAAIWPAYPQLLTAYGRVVHSRNRILRDRPHLASDLLEVYDQQLITQGAKIAAARYRYIEALRTDFSQAFTNIFGEAISVGVSYLSTWAGEDDTNDVSELQRRLATSLSASHAEDLARRQTTVGPHLDDVLFTLDQRPARIHASQGQTRALVLSLKIAQILQVHQRLADYPVLLLDDVSSELDEQRSHRLFAFIRDIRCQVFVTTTRPELLPLLPADRRYHLRQGAIVPEP